MDEASGRYRGGAARPNDRFTVAGAPLRHIDVLAEPNHRKVDTAHLQHALWSFLGNMRMRPVVIGWVRVVGCAGWLPHPLAQRRHDHPTEAA